MDTSNNLEVIFVSEQKVERNYKRNIELKNNLLRDQLRSATIVMNSVKDHDIIKENFAVVMEMFSPSETDKKSVVLKYTLNKVNPWIFILIGIVIVTTIVIITTYVVIKGVAVAQEIKKKQEEVQEIYEKVWSD